MRVGIVRSDVGHMYLADIENRSQRVFSSMAPGQSRYFHKPTTAEQLAFLNANAYLSVLGTVAGAGPTYTFNTTAPANVLWIRAAGGLTPFTIITVTSSAALPLAQLVLELNVAFTNNRLPFVASGRPLGDAAAGQLQIDTKAPNNGPAAYLGIDIAANSTINPIVGFGVGVALTGVPVATFFVGGASIYPTATTIIVSTARIQALYPTWLVGQTAAQKAATVLAFQDFVAPRLVETGPVLLSFVRGDLARWSSPLFRPGGTKSSGTWVGYAADVAVGHIAAECLVDAGTGPFVI